jgi:hypothetical protein
MKEKNIDKIVADQEYWLAKYKFIQSKYPGCNVHNSHRPVTFSSKLVNPKYTNFNISKGYNTLFIEPYLDEEFEYKEVKEMLRVFTFPRRNRLAHIVYPKRADDPKRKDWNGKRTIKFTKFKINLDTRNMGDNCWNECRAAIMKFIKDNSNVTLDTKNLDPSLKKLMIFN